MSGGVCLDATARSRSIPFLLAVHKLAKGLLNAPGIPIEVRVIREGVTQDLFALNIDLVSVKGKEPISTVALVGRNP
jgi:hypothetical protein